MRSIGKISAVGLVTWLMTARRVRGVAAAEDRPHHGLFRRGREREVHDDGRRAGFRGHELDGVEAGVVVVVSGEDLVTGLKVERAQDGVDAGRGVRDESQVVRVGLEYLAQARADHVEMALELVGEEADRFSFHPRAPFATAHGAPATASRRTSRG